MEYIHHVYIEQSIDLNDIKGEFYRHIWLPGNHLSPGIHGDFHVESWDISWEYNGHVTNNMSIWYIGDVVRLIQDFCEALLYEGLGGRFWGPNLNLANE